MTGTSRTARLAAASVVTLILVSTAACEVPDEDSGSAGGSSNDGGAGESESKYTPAQDNAIEAAKAYLDLGGGFSRAGLISQLTSKAGDGYKMADAVFAVNHIKVDYNQQAVLSAKAYLNTSSFSRSGLIQQLSSAAGDQYTVKQATFAADKVGL